MFTLTAMTIGAAMGVMLGLLGGGGAIVAVPALVYVLASTPHQAVTTSLAIVAVGALSGLLAHARASRVRWLVAAKFGLAGAAGAIVGAWISQWIPGERLLALFGLFMLVAAGFMVKRPADSAAAARVTGGHVFALGAAIGIISGLFGVGGGFLIVPALTLGLGLPIRIAVGTSLPIIAINSLAGFAGHISAGEIDWRVTGLVAIGAIAGAWVAGRFAGRVPERAIRIGFAGFVSVVALYLVYRNASALMIVAATPASLAAWTAG